MMNNKTKTMLQGILAMMLFASFTIAGCNNASESKEEPKADTSVKSMEAPPAAAPTVPDTLKKKDTASTRPTPGGG
jgi:hypothetical protein